MGCAVRTHEVEEFPILIQVPLYHAGRWGISVHAERASAYIPRTGLRAYREDISAHTESVSALSV